MQVIPVAHCFDNNYVIPAAVAFYSMLEHANPEYQYNLYVMHTDITEENQRRLIETISCFKNASISFVDMSDRFVHLFDNVSNKAHYSKEIFYKFIPASIFPQYDKIIISDVDVVYLDDISSSFFSFDTSDEVYMAAHRMSIPKGSWVESFVAQYKGKFSDEEIEKVLVSGGYYVYNLRKMREDNIEETFIRFAIDNIDRIRQPEQDVINICCHPKIKFLPFRNLVCSYLYDIYASPQDSFLDATYSREELIEGLAHPVQLHYATHIKPWRKINCTKSEEWLKVIIKTPFLKEWLNSIDAVMYTPVINKRSSNTRKYLMIAGHSVFKSVQLDTRKQFYFCGIPIFSTGKR